LIATTSDDPGQAPAAAVSSAAGMVSPETNSAARVVEHCAASGSRLSDNDRAVPEAAFPAPWS